MKLLIIEDNLKINRLISMYASQEGHQVKSVFSAEDALEHLSDNKVDLVVLDLMLKTMNGETFITKTRQTSNVYIIVVSAKVDVDARVNALSMGADDYMPKPLSIEELMLKIRNLEPRLKSMDKKDATYSFYNGVLTINKLTRVVRVDKKPTDLTQNEFNVLLYLIENEGQTLSRMQILDGCIRDSEAYDRVIDVYIKNIRKKIGDLDASLNIIDTVYGGGYKFVGDKDA
jgi:DNA-binding response OmpR family regulator